MVKVRTNLIKVFNVVLVKEMEALSEIVLPTDLPNLYIKKYSNVLRFMIFLFATTVSLTKLIFYIKKKKVDLKLQDRISTNKSFSRYLENAKSRNVVT